MGDLETSSTPDSIPSILVLTATVDIEGHTCKLNERLQQQSSAQGELPVEDPDLRTTVVFNDPTSLAAFVKLLSSDPSPSLLTTYRLDDSPSIIPLASIKTLQFGLLRSVTAETELTPEEMHGGYRGSFTKPLADEWRTSFRCLNDCWPMKDFCVSSVIFDYANSRNMEAREIVRLVQLVTTVMDVKSGKAGKAVSYDMLGFKKSNQAVLQGALPRARTPAA